MRDSLSARQANIIKWFQGRNTPKHGNKYKSEVVWRGRSGCEGVSVGFRKIVNHDWRELETFRDYIDFIGFSGIVSTGRQFSGQLNGDPSCFGVKRPAKTAYDAGHWIFACVNTR